MTTTRRSRAGRLIGMALVALACVAVLAGALLAAATVSVGDLTTVHIGGTP